MRMKIEDMLQERHLTIVFDEAHFLFPLVNRPKSPPDRLDWLRTALVDHGVTVALIMTPQFDRQCLLYEKHLGWNAAQIRGRVHRRQLPIELSTDDLVAVARKMVPQASAAQLDGLVGFTQGSDDYLAGIERLVCRAKFFATRDGRETFTNADLERALREAMPTLQPVDPHPAPTRKKTAGKARALPLQPDCNRLSETLPAPLTRRVLTNATAASGAGHEAGERLQFTGAAASE